MPRRVHKYCSPTRSSIISGRRPAAVNVLNDDPRFYNPNNPVSGYAAVPPNMTTIFGKMKEANYGGVHVVGKWDCGMATRAQTPKGRGADSSLIYFHHGESSKKDLNVCFIELVSIKNCRFLLDY